MLEESTYLAGRGGRTKRIYYAAVVTTAELQTCAFDPLGISLEDGKIPTNAKFAPVGVVRLTKQLSTNSTDIESFGGYGKESDALTTAKLRTVFVVQASMLDQFLHNFQVDGQGKR